MIIVGDIHGNFHRLKKELTTGTLSKVPNNSVIYFAGDCGFGFRNESEEKQILDELSNTIKPYNKTLIFIRGNHDNPQKWHDYRMFRQNIIFADDYEIFRHKNVSQNVLCLGGAISIDRDGRTKDIDYWPNEEFKLDIDRLNTIQDINYVISHTAPLFCQPPHLFCSKYDDVSQQLILKQRELLTDAYDILSKNNNIKTWIYGHFHNYYSEYHNGTRFVGLDEFMIFDDNNYT